MAEEDAIQVNFGRPMPLFPRPLDWAVLLPQQVMPLHIFEPRYVQMVQEALDGPGQFAMAVFSGTGWKQEYHGRPALRPAVCIGQIVSHEKRPGDTLDLLLQGVCRARILEEAAPSAERLFRAAMLEPVGIDEVAEPTLYGVRERLMELLTEDPLSRLTHAQWVVERIRDEDIQTAVILELASWALPTAREVRYQLLEEADAAERARIIESELLTLQRLIRVAAAQHPENWPKGCSWN